MRFIVLSLSVALMLGNIVHKQEAASIQSIGVIHHPNHDLLANMLRKSVTEVNRTLTGNKYINLTSIRTTSSMELLSYNNLKNMSCAIAIFDLSFGDHHSFSFAEVLGIPLFSFKPILQDLSNRFVYSALPSYDMYARAIIDVIVFTIGEDSPREKVAIVFEDEYSRVATKVYSIARELERFEVDAIPEVNINNKEEFQRGLEVLPKTGANIVLVICRQENLDDILEKALQLGAISENSRWFALNMDFSGNISKKCFKGLVGLRVHLADPERAQKLKEDAESQTKKPKKGDLKKTSEVIYALVNDTLFAVVEAFKKDAAGKIPKLGNCFTSGKRTTSGIEMLKNLNNKVNFAGITGEVSFDNNTRSRMVERLDIVNVQVQESDKEETESVLVNVGLWNANEGKTTNKPVQLNNMNAIDWTGDFWQELQCLRKQRTKKKGKALEGRTLKVVTIEDSPFCENKSSHSGDKETKGGHGYEGFSIELLEEMKDRMGFDYELEISKEGTMNSLIKHLQDKKAHVAIGAITITSARELKVDFSKPFMDFKISLLMPKPSKEDLNLFGFLLPFEMDVWLSTIAVVLGITLLIYCLDYFSPSGYRARAVSTGDGDGDELNLFNSLWFSLGSILQQGADNTPRCASGRMLAGAFWFFTLILISTYTANLAAYFTAKNIKSTIQSLEDLANQNKIKYGVLNDGSLSDFFKKSEVETYQKMYNTMKKGNTFVNSTKDGVAKVQEGGFAYLTDEPYLDYYNMKEPCNTTMLKNLLEAKSYGIALQRNSDLTEQFSVVILKLREEGFLDKLRQKWWDHRSDCQKEKPASATTMRISLDHMAGVFIVLAGGIVVSIVFLLIERRCSNLKEQLNKPESMMSVRDLMDQPTITPRVFSRPLSFETKAFNNVDNINCRSMEAKDEVQPRDNLGVPRRQARLPNIYAGAPESNL